MTKVIKDGLTNCSAVDTCLVYRFQNVHHRVLFDIRSSFCDIINGFSLTSHCPCHQCSTAFNLNCVRNIGCPEGKDADLINKQRFDMGLIRSNNKNIKSLLHWEQSAFTKAVMRKHHDVIKCKHFRVTGPL